MTYVYNPFINNFDEVSSSSGSGVDGPGVPVVDNTLVRWNGTDGANIQGSGAILDDSDNLSLNSISLNVSLDVADGGTGASTEAGARLSLGLDIGSDVQAWNAGLDDISSLSKADSNFIVGNGTNWVAENTSTARTSLGLGSIATQNSSSVSITGGSISGITDLTVADGGSGVSSFVAFNVVCAGPTSTGPLQSVGSVGSTGQVLTSQGAGALPHWTTIAGTGDVTAALNITDNAVVRGDGGAKGVQSSGLIIDDSNNLSGTASITMNTAGGLRTATTDTNTLLLQAYDVDGAAYTTFLTLTAANTPTCDLSTSCTIGSNAFYFATGTDIPVTDGGTGASDAPTARTNLGLAIGSDVQAYDADLGAIAALASAGLISRTGAGTADVRTITGTSNQISVSNGDGVGGNPTLSTPQDIATSSSVTFGNVTLGTGGALRTSTSAAETLLLQAYDVDGTAYKTFATLTANNTPTMDLDTDVTINGAYIYRASGTDLPVADGGSGLSSATAFAVLCGGTTSTSPFQSIAGVGISGQVLTSNGAGALPTFQSASGGFTWNSVAGTTQSMAVNNGYIVANASQTTLTLPSSATVGDRVAVTGYGAAGWIIDYGTSQLIHFLGTDSTTTTGNLTSSNRYDAIELQCVVTDNEWSVIRVVGNITVT